MSTRKTNTYFTSDWHLFHENSLKFDNRPFKDIHHMHRVLVNNYNASVRPEDICYFVGDMGMGNVEGVRKIISELNGTKIFIIGNHDKGYQSMYNMGFDVVQHGAMLTIAHHQVTISHCPLRDIVREDTTGMRGSTGTEPWHGHDRPKHKLCSLPDFGQFHLHGHIHSPNRGKSKKILDKQYDVGVVGNNYRPVSISTIESWIAKYGKN